MTEFLRLLRQLRRAPGFTLPLVMGIAIAIGATTAVFSVFSAMLIRALGFDNPHRLVALWRADEAHGQKSVELSYRDLTEWRKADDVLDGMALASSVNLDLAVYAGHRPEQVDSTTVSGNYFRVLGATPFAGRLLTDDDDRAGAPAAVLSYRFWRTRLDGDFSIVGKSLRISGGAITVVGIARPEFDFPRGVAVWLPLHAAWPDVEQSAELAVFPEQALGGYPAVLAVHRLRRLRFWPTSNSCAPRGHRDHPGGECRVGLCTAQAVAMPTACSRSRPPAAEQADVLRQLFELIGCGLRPGDKRLGRDSKARAQ